MVFADAGMAGLTNAPLLSYRPDCDVSAGLGDFLSRPVAINTFSWAEGSTTILQNQFKPWSSYFNTTSIKNKVSNYARFRGNLHLKFVVNASPFYYGALRICYCPMDGGFRDLTESAGDQIKFSQMPGEFLYPADMTSTEIELPFIWPFGWLDLSQLADFENMGQISYYLYAKLRSANGTTGSNVTITCYAWATNVELAGLTSGLVLQSSEYDNAGPISGPATAVANVAARLTDAPVIGPLARATEIGARAVGGIASLFGYSNPPVIDDVHAFVPKSFHSFASVETGVPMDKLCIDPKNEITIDKSVTGAGKEDELVISHFCGRQSFVTGTLWTEAYAPGTQLLRIPVTPRNVSSIAGVSQSFINETPAAHAAAMFYQWRGGIEYTLRFVKTRYHTGRVMISWDPETSPLTNVETTTVTRVMDLQDETEVTFKVPYKSASPWLLTDNAVNNWANDTTSGISFDLAEHNGCIRVTVLNELTGPSSSQQIDILLFVKCSDDFQLSAPRELPLWSFLKVQSSEQIANVGDDTVNVETNAVTVGESVASLRTLLHRTSLFHREYMGNPYSSAGIYNRKGVFNHMNYIPRFPTEYGFNPEATNYGTGLVSATKKQFQFSPNHPLGWVSNCFVGYRGGIVHQYNTIANGQEIIGELRAEREPISHIIGTPPAQAVNRFSVRSTTSDPSTLSRYSTSTQLGVLRDITGHRGMAVTNTNTQSGLSIITPQYSRWKFRPAFVTRRDNAGGYDEGESVKVGAFTRGGMSGDTTDDGWPILSIYMAGAVDFDLIYFVCVPTMYEFVNISPDNTY